MPVKKCVKCKKSPAKKVWRFVDGKFKYTLAWPDPVCSDCATSARGQAVEDILDAWSKIYLKATRKERPVF